MINKLKIGLLIAVLSLTIGVGSAGAAGLTFSSDTAVTVNGNDYIIRAGSVATTVVVNPTTLVVTLTAPDVFTLASESGHTLTNVADDLTTATETCADGVGTIAYTAVGTRTLTITPSTTVVCTVPSGGGGGSHHSSSSSSSSSNNEQPTTAEGCAAGNLFSTTTGGACSTVIVGCGLGNAFSPVTGQACGPGSSSVSTSTSTTTTTSTSSGSFGIATVKLGTKGEACRAWQVFFNNHAGAHLVLDGNCGPLTMAAARSWQASVGLVADGLLGPKSRAKALMTI